VRSSMTQIAATVCTVLGASPPAAANPRPIASVTATLAGSPRLAIVAIDALGESTLAQHSDRAPTLAALGRIRRGTVRSVIPAITPVNFSTMATGAGPNAHGVRVRTDPLPLDTVFHRLRAVGKTGATASRDLSSVGKLLAPLADWGAIAYSNVDSDVLDLAIQVISAQRPDFLLVHFLDVDDASHADGPSSELAGQALAVTDRRLRALLSPLAAAEYALIVLADHGQHEAQPEDNDPSHRGTHSGRVEADVLVPLFWATADEVTELAK
jgi:predicted AlkP superfamily pyrophosphatase or phosphodiesterase